MLLSQTLLELGNSFLKLLALGIVLVNLLAPPVARSTVLFKRSLHSFVLGFQVLSALFGIFLCSLCGLSAMTKFMA
ncbi:hypothetical protein, partial [Klebsiella pneumoniae]|uniref:hypothetical protein n=1 Tax=Klebsiella pneumoniae TaxID=573 RepID=UPI003D35AC13